jgi:hypothetical protein
MNLFRSEEHVRNWSGFKSGTEEGIVELSVLVKLFSVETFTRRLDPDYVSRIKEYRDARNTAWGEIMKMRPFWSPKAP